MNPIHKAVSERMADATSGSPCRPAARHAWSLLILTAGFYGLLCSELSAANLPNARLQECFPPGARQGTTVNVTISGLDLEDVHELVFSHPGISATQLTTPARSFETQPQPVPDQFAVTVAADVPPGSYEVRALSRHGLSSARPFKVSDLPEVNCDASNMSPATAMKLELNTIVNCPNSTGESARYYEFQGQAGKPVMIHCESRSIDSKMVSVLEVLNPEKNPVAFGRSTNFREAVVSYTPEVDGPYLVKVYESTFRTDNKTPYRLELSTRPWIDFVCPPVGVPGTTSDFTLYGYQLPGGVPAVGIDPRFQLEQLNVSITVPQETSPLCLTSASPIRQLEEAETTGFEYRLTTGDLPSFPVFISTTTAPVVLENDDNNTADKAQSLSLPCAVAGDFFPGNDTDWFTFTGVKGKTYWIDVVSERLSLPTDPAVVVEQVTADANGVRTGKAVKELDDPEVRFANGPFDAQSHDAGVLFTAEADGEYRIQVRDVYAGANSHPRNIYLMLVREAVGDFRLVATAKELGESASLQNPQHATTPTLRQGGCHPVVVQLYREEGFTGPVTLTAQGLPPGVSCPPVTIEHDQYQGTLQFCAAIDAPAWHGTIKIQGTAEIDGKPVTHDAVGATVIWDKEAFAQMTFSRVLGDIALSVVPEVLPMSMVPAEDKVWETSRAGKLPIKARFDRHTETIGNMKLEIRGLPTANYPLSRIPNAILDPQVVEGQVEIAVDAKMPPGDYPCYLTVQTRAMYSRNPEAAKAAEERKTELETLITKLTESSTASEAAKAAADKALADLMAASAETATPEAVALAKQAQTDADAAAKQAKQQLMEAQAELPHVTKRANDRANAAKPAEIALFSTSPSLVVRVRELPLEITLPATATIPAGTAGEIPVSFEKLFGFQDGVTFEAKLPPGVPGLSFANVAIPSETSGKLILKTTAETPPGKYPLTIIAKVNFNGQGLQAERPIEIQIDPAAPASEPAK